MRSFLCFTHFNALLGLWGREHGLPAHFPALSLGPEGAPQSHHPPLPQAQDPVSGSASHGPKGQPLCRFWPSGGDEPVLAVPMPHLQAETGPRIAVTSASEFKTEPEALAEAEVPAGKHSPGQVLGWDKACGRALRPSIGPELVNGLGCGALRSTNSTVREGDPESPHVPLGVLTGPVEKRGTASRQRGRGQVGTRAHRLPKQD